MWRKEDGGLWRSPGVWGKVFWAPSFLSGFLYVMETPRFDEGAGLTAFQAQSLGLVLM